MQDLTQGPFRRHPGVARLGLMLWWTWLILSLAVIAAVWLALVGGLFLVGRREEARALAPFIPDCLGLVSRLLRAARCPLCPPSAGFPCLVCCAPRASPAAASCCSSPWSAISPYRSTSCRTS